MTGLLQASGVCSCSFELSSTLLMELLISHVPAVPSALTRLHRDTEEGVSSGTHRATLAGAGDDFGSKGSHRYGRTPLGTSPPREGTETSCNTAVQPTSVINGGRLNSRALRGAHVELHTLAMNFDRPRITIYPDVVFTEIVVDGGSE